MYVFFTENTIFHHLLKIKLEKHYKSVENRKWHMLGRQKKIEVQKEK